MMNSTALMSDTPPTGDCPRVLIADDDAHFRDLLKIVALSSGWEIAGEAQDGKQAVEMFKSLGPDMVWLDVYMPQLDSKDTLAQITEHQDSAMVIVFTGDDSTTEIQPMLDAGARYHVAKAAPGEMTERIRNAWRAHRNRMTAQNDPDINAL